MEWHVTQGLSNPFALARRDFYGVSGTPTAWFDGQTPYSGSTNVLAEYRNRLQVRLAVGAPLSVEADVAVDAGANVAHTTVTVTLADGETVPSPGECVVRLALFEENVSYCCDAEGGSIFPHVGRSLTDGLALDLSAGGVQVVTEDLAIDPAWVVANLGAVAFVQRTTTKAVLNAARATVAEPSGIGPGSGSWARAKALYRGAGARAPAW